MKTKNKQQKKIFCSLIEIEKEFLPNSYKKKSQEQKEKEPGYFGETLAIDLLKRVERELKNS